ncbi:sensor histidine kinase [Saccharibacillus sp. JS10]|uniref:sensor histidine kinase n=1 Tax=Saccharibacillus sp. JS10 TaxID=2950552 RepID=UPI00210E0F00|nr:sensor histidine kinase [Saccharibacillus sp. JS10]MCQ4085387.1 sensor histidine kinase [Saccharibacillus sp. JS10]
MKPRRLILSKLNDLPLKRKFLLIYLLCVLLPIMTINLFFYFRTVADIQTREQENLRRSLERASGELIGMIDESIALSRSIAADDFLYKALDETYASPSDYYVVYDESLRDKLTRYMSANIGEVRVYTDNQSIQSGSNYGVLSDRYPKPAWLDALKDPSSSIAVTAYMDTETQQPRRRLSVVGKMDVYPSYATYPKYSKVDLDLGRVSAILNRERSVKFRLVNHQNQVVADGIGGRDGEGSLYANPALTPEQKKSGFALEQSLGNLRYIEGWKVVGIADTRYLDGLRLESMRSILWLGILSTILPSLLIFFIFRSYHSRIKHLYRHMEKVGDQRFDSIVIAEGKDEIGGLIRAFNSMSQRIRLLIDDVYKLEIRQKNLELDRVRTELAMLQSQVNPHFLFNTLNAVMIVCAKNGYREVTEIVKNLSMLMRQLLNRPDDLVPLEEELKFIKMYLDIEKFRFGDRFDYVFRVEPSTLSLRIPSMSLQPLVENACKHGLQAIKGDRKIEVIARMTGDGLQLAVSDNGIGISESRICEIEKRMASDYSPDGNTIGLRNVHRRLELFYRRDVHLSLQSQVGQGTVVGFTIPSFWLHAEDPNTYLWDKEA